MRVEKTDLATGCQLTKQFSRLTKMLSPVAFEEYFWLFRVLVMLTDDDAAER